MIKNERLVKFYSRWNIEIDNEKEYSKLKNRILNVINTIFNSGLRADKNLRALVNRFTLLQGIIVLPTSPMEAFLVEDDFSKSPLYLAFLNSKTENELVECLQNLFWAMEETSDNALTTSFFSAIKEVIEISYSGFTLVKKGKRIYVLPVGAKELDEKTVKDVLIWLEEHPKSLKAFEQALVIYQQKDKAKYRNLVDNLRVSIEQLLKDILKNTKSLEKQKEPLLRWLDQKGVHVEIRNLYNQLLFGQYTTLQNDAAKHGDDDFSYHEIEYLIYLTGTFLRLIIQLEAEKKGSKQS